MISLEYITLLTAFEIQVFKTCFLGCVYTNRAESQLDQILSIYFHFLLHTLLFVIVTLHVTKISIMLCIGIYRPTKKNQVE